MLPDPLRLAIALVPLASYCLLIGLLNARRRPFLTTGGSDLAALGFAFTGLVLVGPVELFRPEAASAEFGSYVWLFLLVFYWLCVWLAVLLAKPRLVVYNISVEELRPVLAEAARAIDPQARWAGDSLSLPTLGVQLHLESFDLMQRLDRSQRLPAESGGMETTFRATLPTIGTLASGPQPAGTRDCAFCLAVATGQHGAHARPSTARRPSHAGNLLVLKTARLAIFRVFNSSWC